MKKAILSIALALSVGAAAQCKGSDNNDQFLTLLILFYILDNPPPVQLYLDRADTALLAWQIGLQTGLRSSGRAVNPGFQYNPQNWITVAGSDCVAKGVPGDLLGANCPLTGGVIGVCATRFFSSTGQIVDTTAVLLNSFQTSASSAEAQSVFTHEVGHCLGLKHTASTLNIMFADTSGANTPSAAELSAVDAAYEPTVQSPDTITGNAFFTGSTGGPYVRHFSFPQFHTSATIGSRFSIEGSESLEEDEPPPGPPVGDDVVTIIHKLYFDGREEIEIHDARGRQKFQDYYDNLPPR